MSNRLNSLKEAAYKEALKSEGKFRHGAIVLGNGGRVLAKACNNYDSGFHAEVRALKRVPHDAKDSVEEVVVVRARKDQKYGLSKPCPKCKAALKAARVKVVYFSTNGEVLDVEFYEENGNNL
jgi:tRNA(Arg) A34 adenosine deaminase TadA